MYKQLHKRLNQITNDEQEFLLSDGLIGIEKESLRVDNEGRNFSITASISIRFITH